MADCLLKVEDLSVSVEDKEILKGINLEVKSGETHVIMGPNGAGKSTLGLAIMGNPKYAVTKGKISLEGEDITEEPANERAKKGLFLSFQAPIEVPGITLSEFLRNALQQRSEKRVKFWDFKKEVEENMNLLNMDEKYLQRDLNVGFSGGEKKKAEVLQLLTLKPKLAILDETDSGLDVDAVKMVSKGISEYMKKHGGSLIIITHNTSILESLSVDKTHVLVKGKIEADGDGTLVKEILESGFSRFDEN